MKSPRGFGEIPRFCPISILSILCLIFRMIDIFSGVPSIFLKKSGVPPTVSKFFFIFSGVPPKKLKISICFAKNSFFLGTPRKNIYKIRIFCRESVPRSPSARRGFQKPLGHPAGPSGIFQIPSGLGGIWAKIPSTKSEFSIQIL